MNTSRDPIEVLIDEITTYKKNTPMPDNQLGLPNYLYPLLSRYSKIKNLAEDKETSIKEQIDAFNGGSRKQRRKTRKQRK